MTHVTVAIKYIFLHVVGRVFAKGLAELGSIPGRHTKDSKNDT